MRLTIENALLQGSKAHKAGKFQEAEKYYRAIISSQAQHPVANHNLGVLAVGVSKVKEALPYFKNAVEANPEQGQFWLSYIDALIKLGRMDDARQVLEQGKGIGLKGDQVNTLETRLNGSTISTSPVIESTRPDQQQLNNLISLYTQGNLKEALVQGSALSKQFPVNPYIPNILGAIYSGLGKDEEAIASYKKAIELKPDFIDAYNNLGVAVKDLGKYEEAIIIYEKALLFNPDYAELYNNLGLTHYKLKSHQDAIINYKKAIELKPDLLDAHTNLGDTLQEIGSYEEAIASFEKGIKYYPRSYVPRLRLSLLSHELGEYSRSIEYLVVRLESSRIYNARVYSE